LGYSSKRKKRVPKWDLNKKVGVRAFVGSISYPITIKFLLISFPDLSVSNCALSNIVSCALAFKKYINQD
jgi:hypothetical protein